MHLAALTQLRCLGIGGTLISDATTTILRSLTRIEMLNVNRTAITDIGLMNLSALQNLRTIEIRDAKTTSKGIARFRETLPACLIVTEEQVLWPLP